MSRLDEAMVLVSIPSVSRNEERLAGHIERRLRENPALDVERIGDNVVARTRGHHQTRLLVAGHLDTVPGDQFSARIVNDHLVGLGACDMKGSLSVMLELALDPSPRSIEVTWVFYAREEIARSESGLLEIGELRPDLLDADAAILAEPTGGFVEAGCQGTLRIAVELTGVRAHVARPFTGRNAIHRMGELIHHVARYEPRVVEIEGVTYVEQLQAVAVDGGVASNVVPDRCSCTFNHRVAPDRSRSEAIEWLRGYLEGFIETDDTFEVLDWAPPAGPNLSNARLQSLVEMTGGSARGKVGWTDVATLCERGVPATNFGAGDPLLAHHSDEFVTADDLDHFAKVLGDWLR
ncbi:MAG: succinyl-diaminopimelate desuccinylase [Acidimicrobiaceae bacterium]|nr:succinyl-diaminopimelate desuccinylase [Acidimicrobiaceae bacterium]